MSLNTDTPTTPTPAAKKTIEHRRRATIAGSAGMFIEFYEYGIYGAMAPIIAVVFFPASDGLLGVLATWAIFGVTFLFRPLGGIILGVLGDRVGRKRALMCSIWIITVATTLIGLSPGYAAIGVAAPVLLLLLRLAQGFSAGGEVSAAMTFVGEHADPGRRAFSVSFVQVASFSALLLGTTLGLLLTTALDDAAMYSWGWRIPFLLALPLGLVGLWIRRSIGETEVFTESKAEGRLAQNPLREIVSSPAARRRLWIAMILPVLNGVGYYVIFNYLPTYLTSSLDFSASAGFVITSIGLAVLCLAIPFAGMTADRIGRRKVLIGSAALMALLAYPAYLVMQLGDLVWAIGGIVLLAVLFSGQAGVIHTSLLELFPAAVRTTAYSLGYNIGLAVFGGAGPLLVTAIIARTGNAGIPSYYVIAAALMTFVCALVLTESKARSLKD